MKLKGKDLRLIAVIVALIGIAVAAYTNYYNDEHPLKQNDYGIYLGLGIAVLGLFLQGLWSKKK